MKNQDLIRAVASAIGTDDGVEYGIELLDTDLDAIAGGLAGNCNSFKCGTYSSPAQTAD